MPNGVPPLASDGVFCVSGSILIDAQIENVWEALTDFAGYVEWNPFVRGQTIIDSKSHKPLSPQPALSSGHLLSISPVHLPPTLDEPALFQKQSTLAVATTVDRENYRVAWETAGVMPKWLLHAERWQMLTKQEDGKVKYESLEVFNGLFAYLVKLFVGKNLFLGVDAMAEGLKKRAEGN